MFTSLSSIGQFAAIGIAFLHTSHSSSLTLFTSLCITHAVMMFLSSDTHRCSQVRLRRPILHCRFHRLLRRSARPELRRHEGNLRCSLYFALSSSNCLQKLHLAACLMRPQYKKKSYIVFVIVFVIAASTVLLLTAGGISMVKDIRAGRNLGFESLC